MMKLNIYFFLAKINTKTGEEVDNTCFKQVKKHNITYREIKSMDFKNREGFDVRFMEKKNSE